MYIHAGRDEVLGVAMIGAAHDGSGGPSVARVSAAQLADFEHDATERKHITGFADNLSESLLDHLY
jgi:hypothetical protein